jgi:hypothetical protein
MPKHFDRRGVLGSMLLAQPRGEAMIKDAKGRKWSMRFRHSPYGWRWDARHGNWGQGSDPTAAPFATKAQAEDDARQQIQSHDAIAAMKEFFRRRANAVH